MSIHQVDSFHSFLCSQLCLFLPSTFSKICQVFCPASCRKQLKFFSVKHHCFSHFLACRICSFSTDITKLGSRVVAKGAGAGLGSEEEGRGQGHGGLGPGWVRGHRGASGLQGSIRELRGLGEGSSTTMTTMTTHTHTDSKGRPGL